MYKTIAILFSKFATIGAFCAFFSLSSNFFLLKYMDTPLILTYVVVYVISIFLSFTLNSSFTFQSKKNLRNARLYYLIYISSMMLGVVLLQVYEIIFDFQKWIYPFMVIPFTMIWNFTCAIKFLKNE